MKTENLAAESVAAGDHSLAFVPVRDFASVAHFRFGPIAILLISDFAMLVGGIISAVIIRKYSIPEIDTRFYLGLWPAGLLFLGGYYSQRLYDLVGANPAEELRRTTLATTVSFLGLAAATFILKEADLYSRGIFLIAWVLSLASIPLGRAIVRWLFARRQWWGHPVVILGAGTTGEMIVRTLLREPGIGLKPVAILDDDPSKHGELHGIPVPGGLALADEIAQKHRLHYAVVAMPRVPHEQLLRVLEKYATTFSHLIVIPDMFGFASLRVPVQDLGGTLGLEVRQQLLLPLPRFSKRTMDLLVTIIGGILILPLLLAIAILIKLDSSGPILYCQNRPGRQGKLFKIWKFRTMYMDADVRFQQLPAELKAEFLKYGKIKRDPRVTRLGKTLRKFSLDELPQLWNVLVGDLSLVGPRPYLQDQVDLTEHENIVMKVLPGLTGLWQVSGRSTLTFEDRIKLDTYYVRNWSIWLDLWILARTVPVLVGEGAY